MLLRLMLVVLVTSMLGCAHRVSTDAVIANEPVTVLPTVKSKQPEAAESQPSKLDAALLYSLLGGEVAGQRGDINMASAFYVEAAKLSKDPEVALRAAQIALYSKDVGAAKSAIDIAVDSGGVSAESHRLALTIYLRSGDIKKSLSQIAMMLEKSDIPQRNALLAIGDIVARHASKNVGIQVVNELVKTYPDEAGIYLVRSKMMSQLKQWDNAEDDATIVTKLDPVWPVGFAQLSLVLESKGETERALSTLKSAGERLKARQLMMGYGQLLAKNERYEAAKVEFLKLVSQEEDYPEANFALGLVYLKLGEAAKAIAVFKDLYAVNGFSSQSAFYLGRIYYFQKVYQDALLWFGRVTKGVQYIDSQATTALIKSEMGDLQGARSILQTLRNEYPENATRFYLLESELLMVGQHNKVLYDLLNEAIKEAPDDLALRYARSIAATDLDEVKVAEKDLLFVLAKDPNNVNALNALGYTLASKTFRFKEARQYLTQALSLRPSDPAILDSMGWLNYREGHYEEALVLLQRAYQGSPEGEIAAHLGEALWMLGRQKEARQLWEEGLKRDSDNKHLIEVLKRLQ